MRNKRGQSALEYVALITLLAGIVVAFIFSRNEGSMGTQIRGVYTSAGGQVDKAAGWMDSVGQ
jgi:Flp pilus assembly pilin Flp